MTAPDKAVFRLPVSALFIPIGLFVFATPLAAASVWTLPLYLLPVYGLFYVLVTRTVADDRTIEAHLPLRTRRIPWADLDGFEFQGPRWAIAVTQEGRRIRLPMVRPRDLRRLAQVSGGRLYLGEDAAEQAEVAADASSASTSLRTNPATAAAGDAAGPMATDTDQPVTGATEVVETGATGTSEATGATGATGATEPAGETDDGAATQASPAQVTSSDDAGRRAPE